MSTPIFVFAGKQNVIYDYAGIISRKTNRRQPKTFVMTFAQLVEVYDMD
jgi:hypothetical protein